MKPRFDFSHLAAARGEDMQLFAETFQASGRVRRAAVKRLSRSMRKLQSHQAERASRLARWRRGSRAHA